MKRTVHVLLLALTIGTAIVAVEATPLSPTSAPTLAPIPTVEVAEAGWKSWDQGGKGQWWWQQDNGYWFWHADYGYHFLDNGWANRYSYWGWEWGNLGPVVNGPYRDDVNHLWRVDFGRIPYREGGWMGKDDWGFVWTCFYFPEYHCHWA